MIQREFSHISVASLVVTDINMRHAKKAPDITDLLPSIRQRGVLQSLLVRKNGDSYEVAAGRRRYFSLKTIAEETGEDQLAPCLILEPGDDAAAIEASLLENIARRDVDEMTQYETFARLIAEGRTPAEIATSFGIEEKQVEQRLALARLSPRIRDLYRAEQIDVETIRALTLASARQQKEWLKLWKENQAPEGRSCKAWVCGGQSISTEVALFSLEEYKGEIVSDLFGTDRIFKDVQMFWEMQNIAIAARRDKYLAAGWCGVEVIGPDQYFHQWQYRRTAKKNGGKVYIELGRDGSAKFHEGLLTEAENKRRQAKASASEQGGDVAAASSTKPEITQAQAAYIDAHRQAAVRAALVSSPTIAFRLLIAHAISGNGNFKVTEDSARSQGQAVVSSIANSPSNQAFEAARHKALTIMGFAGDGGHSVTDRYLDCLDVFAKMLTLSDIEVMEVAAVVMAESLAAGDIMVEAAGKVLSVSLENSWQPEEIFWEQLRDKAIINAMLREVAGKKIADANLTRTGKEQKELMQKTLTDSGKKWLPRWLKPVAATYSDRGGFRTPSQIKELHNLSPS